MFCTYCGKRIDDDSIFCCYCGKSLSRASESYENDCVSNTGAKEIHTKDYNAKNEVVGHEGAFGVNFVLNVIGTEEPGYYDFTIIKLPTDDDEWDDEEEIDSKEISVSSLEESYKYCLNEGNYSVYIGFENREIKIVDGKIIDFTFDCSGHPNRIYINERSQKTYVNRCDSISMDNGIALDLKDRIISPSSNLFTLHMIGPSKPALFNYQITRIDNNQIIEQGSAYAVSSDNKLKYRLIPGKYEVKIDRYTRIISVGEANDIDLFFDCSHHFNSIKIIGDIDG